MAPNCSCSEPDIKDGQTQLNYQVAQYFLQAPAPPSRTVACAETIPCYSNRSSYPQKVDRIVLEGEMRMGSFKKNARNTVPEVNGVCKN